MTRCCPIVELRQYTLLDNRRDELITLFEREFIETQEAVGIRQIGQFTDLDDPARFVWLRGFSDMDARRAALATFYGGPVWKAHRAAANATILDSDNVLLLKSLPPDFGFAEPAAQPPAGVKADTAIVTAMLHYVEPASLDNFVAFFNDTMRPALERSGTHILATFATEASPNTFPTLPVRENESVFAWFAHAPESGVGVPFSRETAPPDVLRQLAHKAETLRLAPTTRSRLR